ncbi:MAG TPA: excinuclease ABC subunit UvrB [Candidatus Thermoplasmatota archaeon]|nr:excinuclease ABC subunit UvrB [Candidatus Thermoplasmatota archaeon]
MAPRSASVAKSPFDLRAPYAPAGDQPEAIKTLVEGIRKGQRDQTLLGVTGSGKTYTMANVIQQIGRPTLIVSHNKTLAAQLYEEMKEFFPDNAVSYWVSYFDYYQPEAYVPSKDLYIAKESDRNEEIEKMRHATTAALMTRPDVIVVASVSCIYGLGDPKEYHDQHLVLKVGDKLDREVLLRRLIDIYYKRNDQAPDWGQFRARGDVVEVRSPDGENVHRIELFGDELESISLVDPITGVVRRKLNEAVIHPAEHFVSSPSEIERVAKSITVELEARLAEFQRQGKLLEAQRLEQRTKYDLEMLREIGYMNGIENYSRHFTGKKAGEPPYTLLDYFPEGFLTIIDESHVTVPQVRGMYHGDRSRKQVLVDFGFRLPSAVDNRPLTFDEFRGRTTETVHVSATPGPYELEVSETIAEQVVRPTGLLDPVIEIRPSSGQVDDLLGEIRARAAKNERVLVTTLTKRMAEDLTDYYASHGVRVRYLHSDVTTLDRVDLLEDLRSGQFDVLVGINLLREGLDLPEVSLVAIFDADKEGFLRSETSLIQTFGRAARNVNGKVLCYADQITGSMQRAIDETRRRRAKQEEHNELRGITPQTIVKALRKMRERKEQEVEIKLAEADTDSLLVLADELEAKMRAAAKRLDFETAAMYRDKLREIRMRLEAEKPPA